MNFLKFHQIRKFAVSRALGCVIYEIATLVKAFNGAKLEIYEKIVNGTLPELESDHLLKEIVEK